MVDVLINECTMSSCLFIHLCRKKEPVGITGIELLLGRTSMRPIAIDGVCGLSVGLSVTIMSLKDDMQ